MDPIQEQIDKTVARIDLDQIAMSSVAVASILKIAFPLIVGCMSKWAEKPSPAQMQTLVKDNYEKDPKRTIRGVAIRIKRSSDEKITRKQALIMGKAAVDQMIEEEPQRVAEACSLMPTVPDEFDVDV